MIKKILFLNILIFATAFSKTVPIESIGEYIGDEVKVCGKVYSVYFANKSRGKPVFINIDGYYPKQKLTAVVWNSDRTKFPNLKRLKNKTVCIKGIIEVYRGKFEIVLRDKNQLEIKLEQHSN